MAFDSSRNTLQFDVPETDTIYFAGLPTDITEDEVVKFFGQMGTIKLDKKKRPPTPKVADWCHHRASYPCPVPLSDMSCRLKYYRCGYTKIRQQEPSRGMAL